MAAMVFQQAHPETVCGTWPGAFHMRSNFVKAMANALLAAVTALWPQNWSKIAQLPIFGHL
jgi:hypothetical protein